MRTLHLAMQRAVEILARVYEANRARSNVPPVPLDRPVVLANERIVFALAGDDTWRGRACVRRRVLVSDARLAHLRRTRSGAAQLPELVLLRGHAAGARVLRPEDRSCADLGGARLRHVPAFRPATSLGARRHRIDQRYVTAIGGPAPVVYAEAYEARFPGGVAYVMGNAGSSNASGCTLQRNAALAGALIAIALAYSAFRPAPTQGPFARDFEAYYAAGAAWNAGGDAWSRAIWSAERGIAGVDASRDEMLPYVGPGRCAAALRRARAAAAAACRAGVERAARRRAGRPRHRVVDAGADAARDGTGSCAGVRRSRRSPEDQRDRIGADRATLRRRNRLRAGRLRTPRAVAAVLATLVAGLQPNLALALVARVRDRFTLWCAARARSCSRR